MTKSTNNRLPHPDFGLPKPNPTPKGPMPSRKEFEDAWDAKIRDWNESEVAEKLRKRPFM